MNGYQTNNPDDVEREQSFYVQNNSKFNRQDFLLSGSPLNSWDYADTHGNADLIGNADVTNDDVFIYPTNINILDNLSDIEHIIAYHEQFLLDKYTTKYDYYKGRHQSIITRSGVPLGQPDDRLINNFPKQLVDTFNGYAFGKSPDVTYDDPKQTGDDNTDNTPMDDDIEQWLNATDFEENVDELAKQSSIYGRSYLYVYEAEGQLWYSVCNPIDTIVVYDNTIRRQPLFAIRYSDGSGQFEATLITQTADYKLTKSSGVGSLGALTISNWASEGADNVPSYVPNNEVLSSSENKVVIDDQHPNFPCLPILELYENRSRVGIFDDSINNIDDYNQIASMKSNDLHSFSNNYLVVTGAEMDKRDKFDMKDNRFINLFRNQQGFSGEVTGANPDAKFIQPEADDVMQENMLNRLKNEIYRTAQVVDPEDAADGQTANAISGVVLKQRYSKMHVKASLKSDVLTRVIRGMFKIKWATENVNADVMNLKFNYNFDDPHNILEDAQAASFMNGIYPREAIYKTTPSLLGGESPQDTMDEYNEEQTSNQQAVAKMTGQSLGGDGNVDSDADEGSNQPANSQGQ